VISLIKLILRFAWLVLLLLGTRRAWEIFQGGADQFIDRLEEGESGPQERMLTRLHEALHHRQSHLPPGEDPIGKM
jgi:hypothetical protein